MSKHTPGPWTIEKYGDEDAPALVIHKDSERRVCFMATPGASGDPATIAADARLISAAPELFDFARQAVASMRLQQVYELGRGVKDADKWTALIDAGLAALKKAEG